MKIRGKIMFYALMGTGIIGALLGLAQMWLEILEWDDFVKTLITLVIAGSVISFLTAVDYDMPAVRSRILFAALVVLIVAIAGMVIIQLWWVGFQWGLFAKVVVSLGILTALVAFLLAVTEDFGQNKSLRDKSYIE
jgi:hypothetical protein